MKRKPASVRQRVRHAAAAVLGRDKTIGPLELLAEIGFLHPVHVEQWKKGNSHYDDLESYIQCGDKKLKQTYTAFFEWIKEQNLEPFEASYSKASHTGSRPLTVSSSGDAKQELFYKTHFRSSQLTDKQKQRIEEKQKKAPDLIAYQMVSESAECGDCSETMLQGEIFVLENKQPLCRTCADMDHLQFLPSGDATLTRRARKHSQLSAIVVRFNRSRKRYERQGILVTAEAIDAAQQQCRGDATTREKLRERAALRRVDEDHELVKAMVKRIQLDYPHCPIEETEAIATHTTLRGSGRVGRSAAGRQVESHTISLAVSAWVRHQHTGYDELLMQGIERQQAREQTRDKQEAVLFRWRPKPG